MGISGISSGFPLLSQSSRQVAHVLLTRSPLALPQSCDWLEFVRLACVKHAASVRPEPGSNSPSRSCLPAHKGSGERSKRVGLGATEPLRPTGIWTDVVRSKCFE